MLGHHKASLSSFFFFPCNSFVIPQSFIVFLPIQQCCEATKFHFTHFIYYAVVPQNFIVLILFFPSNHVVTPQSFIVLIYLLPYNNVVVQQRFIVRILFLSIQQCCDITNLHCTHFIYYHNTMLWHHKASLSSFFFFPSNNVVAPQSFIVLILFLPIQQCCGTTKLHCPHSFSSQPTIL